MIDEAKLAAQIAGGRVREACAMVYAEHAGEVDRFVSLSIGGVARREDVKQEVWAAVQKALPKFRFQSPVRTWLLRIAKHKIIDGWREQPLEQTLGSEDVATDGAGSRSSSRARGAPTPSRLLHAKQRVEAVRRALAGLEASEQELLDMRFVLGLKPAEIACVVGGVAPNTVAQRLVRVVRKLHERLRDESALQSFRQGRS